MIENLKKHTKRLILKNMLGVTPEHLTLSQSFWNLGLWKQDEVPFLENNSRLIHNLDKLHREMMATDRKTTVKPEMIQLIGAKNRAIKYRKNIPNILTNAGMAEMAKRSTGQSSLTNTHHAVGTGTTTPTLQDTALQTESARKEIGTRLVQNQTERYGSSFLHSDFSGLPLDIAEAGLLTASSGGILILHVTSDAFEVDTGSIMTVQTNITHENGDEE